MSTQRPYHKSILRSDGFDPSAPKPKLVAVKIKAAETGKRLTETPAPPARRRLPPGQDLVTSFPVLDLGTKPLLYKESWTLTFGGLCLSPQQFTWDSLHDLGAIDAVTDIHCVTGWSQFDNKWRGIPAAKVLAMVGPDAQATHAILKSHDGYGTVVTVRDLLKPDVLFATHWSDTPLTREHGGPVRLVIPHLYFWKSAKWLKQIWFTKGNPGGYWENRGYHHRGDPWQEERYE